MKHNYCARLAFQFVSLSSTIYLFAHTGASCAEVVSWPKCEYKINFATGVRQAEGVLDGNTYKIFLSPKGQMPLLRAECVSVDSTFRKQYLDNFSKAISAQAQEAGIEAPNIQIENTKLGRLGKFTGTVKSGEYLMRVYGRVLIGDNSMLLFTAIEANSSLSPSVVSFLNSVEKR
jgi:hypothetical protein